MSGAGNSAGIHLMSGDTIRSDPRGTNVKFCTFAHERGSGTLSGSSEMFVLLGIGRANTEVSVGDFLDALEQSRRQRLSEWFAGDDQTLECVIKTADQALTVQFLGQRALDGSGIGILHDVTDRETETEELKRKLERYFSFAEHTAEAIVCYELVPPIPTHLPPKEQARLMVETGVLIECNQTHLNWFGLESRDEVVGKTFLEYAEANQGIYDLLAEFCRNGYQLNSVANPEMRPVRLGKSWLLVNLDGIVEDGHLVRMWCTEIDITEIKRAEEERQVLQEKLLQSQKIEAIGQMAEGIAHDFNNVLTAIIGNLEVTLTSISRGDAEPRAITRDLTEARESAERAAALVRQLMVFSRRETVKSEVVDPNRVVKELQSMLKRFIDEAIEFDVRISDEFAAIRSDVGHIEQIVVNLVVNARDAMPDGGVLTIETSNISLQEEVANLEPGQYHCISVRDTGVGMSEALVAKVFEPFFTTKVGGRGTGLGLSTVFGIVQTWSGGITILSEPGNGSCVRVYFPLVDEVPDAREPLAPLGDAPTGNETVLVCEDDHASRMLAIKVLELAGYHVLAAENGIRAIETANAHDGPIHLLLTDIVMPKMNGRELAERLCKQIPNIAVVFCTGYSAGLLPEEMVSNDKMTLLQKPYSLVDLLTVVRESIDSKG